MVYAFCRSSRLQASDAADVTQNVLMRVAKAIQRFQYDRTKGLFRDWLARIVSNEIRRYAVKNHQMSMDPLDIDRAKSPQDAWNEHFHEHILQVALARTKPHFNEQTWQIFELHWIQQSAPDAVAHQLGVSIDKVYVARCRVLKRLRSEVAFLVDDTP